MKWLVIGISGPTNSGKTSLAKKLHNSLEDSVLIEQDKYFLPQDDPRHILIPELNHFNWEILSSLDMEKMYNDVTKIIMEPQESNGVELNDQVNGDDSKFRVMIIEGFLLYNYHPIAELCQLKYFIEITKQECWNRRKNRVYDPPDVPGYFEKVVWPEYLRHKLEITMNVDLNNDIFYVSGKTNLDELHDQVLRDIKSVKL